jgi:hypothetical protein
MQVDFVEMATGTGAMIQALKKGGLALATLRFIGFSMISEQASLM